MKRINVVTFCFLAIGYWLSSAVQSPAAFTAYNDPNFQSGDPGGNITTNNFFVPASGGLVDVGSGSSVGVTATLSPSNGIGYFQYNNPSNPPVGSDAYNVFNGKVGLTNYQVITLGGATLGPYTIRFTGLDSNSAYSFVYQGTRGFATGQYLDRLMSMTVADVDLFTNNSTAGGTNFARYQANDSTERAGGNANGEVWRFDGLKCGADGDMQFELYARGTNGQAANIYFGGYMLQGFDGTNVAGPSVPVIANSSPTVLGANSATLAGSLSSTGNAPTQVWVYWNAGSDAGTTKGSWANSFALGFNAAGALTYTATNLTASTTYYYRYYASNSAGEAWASSAQNFTTQSGAMTGSSGFVAYNDTAWHQDAGLFSGQGVESAAVNYTTNSLWGQTSGALVSDSGQTLSAQVAFSGNPVGLNMLARNLTLPGTTDASTVFSGKIGPNNAMNWSAGVVTMTLSGLDSAKSYNLVLWSSRGGTSAAYSNRWTDITIKSVDLFTNNSSSGLSMFTTTSSNDSTRVVAVLDGGRVARYDGIHSGVDGTIVLDLMANGLAGTTETNGYLNGFMLQEYAGAITPAAPIIANSTPIVLGANSATLAGSLSSTGYVPTQVWVYWKTGSDGGTSKASWANSAALGYRATGALTYTASNLTSNTTYYYRYYASNSVGEVWASSAQSFTTQSGVVTGSTGTIKIMCLGDSITQSVSNYPSYRYWLWKLLTVSNNYNVDFIGPNTNGINGPNLYSDFDRDHAGYWGAAAYEVDGQILSNSYYSTTIPNITLIHLGHNDVGWKDQGIPGIVNATNSISIVIDHLRQKNTNMVIFLAQVIPVNPATNDATFTAEVNELAAAIPTLAASKNLTSSPVIVVDQHTGFDPTNDTWTSDGIHPTVSGEKKMAAKWFTALQSWLPNLVVTNDADTNGMADGWEVSYFGRYGQSPTADPDGDGLNNLQEYILGSSPLATNMPPTFRDMAQHGGFAFDTASQRVYQVDYRTNLTAGSWQFFTNITGDGTEKSLSTSNAPNRGTFYRFKVHVAP